MEEEDTKSSRQERIPHVVNCKKNVERDMDEEAKNQTALKLFQQEQIADQETDSLKKNLQKKKEKKCPHRDTERTAILSRFFLY